MTNTTLPPWPRAVLFDLDGTLVDSAPGIGEAINAVLSPLGCPPLPLREVRRMIGDGAPRLLERALAAHGLSPPAAEKAALMGRYLGRLKSNPPGPDDLYPEASRVVAELRAEGVPLGLCTNKPISATRSALGSLGLDGCFGVVLGGDSLSHRKPEPEPLLAAVEVLGVSAGNAVMIGDSVADIDAARAAGMASVVVSHGYSRRPVETLEADLVIAGLVDLKDALARLRANRA